MSVVGIHPENLIDKLEGGELTASERERLQNHLRECAACRFEVRVRADLEMEAAAIEFAPGSAERLLRMVARPQLLSTPVPTSLRPITRQRRGRWAFGIVGGGLALASGAAALVSLGGAGDKSGGNDTKQIDHLPASAGAARRGEASAPKANVPPPQSTSPASASATDATATVAAPVPHAPAPRTVRQHRRSSSPPSEMADESSASTDEPRDTAATLFSEANRARRAGELASSVQLYRRLQRAFPNSPEAQLSLVTLGTLQLDSGNPRGALVTFERYLGAGGRPLEAEALYGRARALSRLGWKNRAARAWQDLVDKHPTSGYAAEARERLRSSSAP